MIRVKICGITSLEDALSAVHLGADVLGFVFAPSPRRVTPERARDIIRRLPPFIRTAGVFVDETEGAIRETLLFCGLDLAQLHGDETPVLCRSLMPYSIKAFRMRDHTVPGRISSYRGSVRAVLLDSFSEKQRGGTGKTFDWTLALRAGAIGLPIVLSGGLHPDNVEEAVRTVRPYAVDASSGLEKRPGKKDFGRMKAFIMRAKEAGKK